MKDKLWTSENKRKPERVEKKKKKKKKGKT